MSSVFCAVGGSGKVLKPLRVQRYTFFLTYANKKAQNDEKT